MIYSIDEYRDKGKGHLIDGKTLEEVMQTVKSWLFDAEHRIVTERAKIERMKQIEVSAQQMFTLIGMLTSIRVKCDSRNKSIHENRVYPLNQAQISDFTEQMLIRYDAKRIITAWDIYDAATELYKANTMDIPSLMPQNRAMVRFLDEQFNLETLEV